MTAPLPTLHDLETSIRKKRSKLDQRLGEANALNVREKGLQQKVDSLKTDINTYDKAILLLNSISEERQEAAQRQIEDLVTKGLQTIFGNMYSFHVIKTKNGSRHEVDFIIRSYVNDNIIETPVLGARGGGIAAVVGVLLRVIILLLSHKDKSTPLILDESLAQLSGGYLTAFCKFIRELVDMTNIQVIMVTHQHEFAHYADKIYEFTSVKGLTRAKELSVSDI